MEYFNKKAPRLVKGRDFYEEGDLVIFTERYHQSRGYCCKSDCRHCPYRTEILDAITLVNDPSQPARGRPR